MLLYPEAIQTIKHSKVPWPVVAMQLVNGLKDGQTCGGCASYRDEVCQKAWSKEAVPAETPACGKFKARES